MAYVSVLIMILSLAAICWFVGRSMLRGSTGRFPN